MGCGPSSKVIPASPEPILQTIESTSQFIENRRDPHLDYLQEELNNYEHVLKNIREILDCYLDNNENKVNMLMTYNELVNKCNEQKSRMNKDAYEVAIIGLEKAGKSTLINAWIGWNFLPTAANRCTYTLTRICATNGEQKYEIEYFNRDEFYKRFDKLKDAHDKSADSSPEKFVIKEEIEEIRQHLTEINKYLGNPKLTVSVTDFLNESVKNEISSSITNIGKARAIKNISFWVANINSINNFTLYDAPGYNSPITMHKEQTTQIIQKMDVVLYAKDISRPDLDVLENNLVKITSESDEFVEVKEKIIVALTQGEKNLNLKNSSDNNSTLERKSKMAWARLGVSDSRVITVFTKAELEKSSPNPTFPQIQDTRMDLLKKTVSKCVVESRFKFSEKRIKGLRSKIEEFVKILKSNILADFGINFDSNDSNIEEDEDDDVIDRAFRSEWEMAKAKFTNFFADNFKKSYDIENNAELANGFISEVDKSFQEVTDFLSDKDKMYNKFNMVMADRLRSSPSEGNVEIRKKITEDANKSTQSLSNKLGAKFESDIIKIKEWIRKEILNDENRVNKWLPTIFKGEKVELEERVKLSFDVLFKRFSRSAIQLYLRFPRKEIDRKGVMEEYVMDLRNFNIFYQDGKHKLRGTYGFLSTGVLDTSIAGNDIFDDEGNVDFKSDIKKIECRFDEADTFEKVVKEINDDYKEFLLCIKHSVYHYSGVASLYVYELDRIRVSFSSYESEDYWKKQIKATLISLNSKEREKVKLKIAPVNEIVQRKKIIINKFNEIKRTLSI